MKIYKIGGCVRDKIIGRPVHDIDYEVVGATVDEMLALGYARVGKDFPVFLHPETKEEYALARKEISTGLGHKDFEFDFNPSVTLEESSLRRDFTMNAIAEDEHGLFHDFYGGIADIQAKCIRHIYADGFVQDPLRLLRGARFAAQLGFTIAPETMELFKHMVSIDMLEHLSADRVWKETEKALAPGCQSQLYFEILNDCGALERLFPELWALTNTPENPKWHPSGNTFAHTMIALRKINDRSTLAKFTILCHDFGKALTPADILPKHHGHAENGIEPITEFCDRTRVPVHYKKCACRFCEYHMRAPLLLEMRLGTQYDMIKELCNFKQTEALHAFLDALYADFVGEDVEKDLAGHNAVVERINRIIDVMKDVTVYTLSDVYQARLAEKKGTEFYKLYRMYRLEYLRKNI